MDFGQEDVGMAVAYSVCNELDNMKHTYNSLPDFLTHVVKVCGHSPLYQELWTATETYSTIISLDWISILGACPEIIVFYYAMHARDDIIIVSAWLGLEGVNSVMQFLRLLGCAGGAEAHPKGADVRAVRPDVVHHLHAAGAFTCPSQLLDGCRTISGSRLATTQVDEEVSGKKALRLQVGFLMRLERQRLTPDLLEVLSCRLPQRCNGMGVELIIEEIQSLGRIFLSWGLSTMNAYTLTAFWGFSIG